MYSNMGLIVEMHTENDCGPDILDFYSPRQENAFVHFYAGKNDCELNAHSFSLQSVNIHYTVYTHLSVNLNSSS